MYKTLQRTLRRIRAGYSVDWNTAARSLRKIGIDQKMIDRAVVVKPYGTGVHQVTIIDPTAFSQIEILANPRDNSSRSSASLRGDSHAASVNGAMLAVWSAGEAESVNRIFKDNLPSPLPRHTHALIIENEECFLHKEDIFRFVQSQCGVTHPIEDIEFIYGSGNSISNRRIIPYLKAFQGDVLCLLDVDLGGLKIYTNLLAAGMREHSTHYLIPRDLNARLERSKREASDEELEALSSIYGKSAVADKVITTIRHFKATVEQESYRADQ